MRRHSILLALVLVSIGARAAPPEATAGPNVSATLPLHAVVTGFGPCDIDDPCDPGPPTVQIPGNTMIAVYLLARNYVDLVAVQTAFDWTESWFFFFGLWDCLPGQVTSAAPVAPGAEKGTLTTSFDPMTGVQTIVLGRMHMLTSESGCIQQVDSSFPEGTHFVSSSGEIDPPEPYSQTGTVCAGYDLGEDRCTVGPIIGAVCCRDNGSCDGLFWRCNDGYVLTQRPCYSCVWQGACCYPDGSCENTDSNTCGFASGTLFFGRTCDEVECPTPVEPMTWGRIKARHRE